MVKLQLTMLMFTVLAIADNHESEETQAEEAPTEEPSVWNNWNGNPAAGSYFD